MVFDAGFFQIVIIFLRVRSSLGNSTEFLLLIINHPYMLSAFDSGAGKKGPLVMIKLFKKERITHLLKNTINITIEYNDNCISSFPSKLSMK